MVVSLGFLPVDLYLVCDSCPYDGVWLETVRHRCFFLPDLFLYIAYKPKITHPDPAGAVPVFIIGEMGCDSTVRLQTLVLSSGEEMNVLAV